MPIKRPVQPQRQSQLPAGFIGLLRRALADLGFTAGGGGGGGVTDHGALTGLADDDHSHYHNNARGDARYSLLAHNHSGTYDPAGTAAAAVSAHAAAADPHPAYLTATEGNAAYSAIGHGHGGTYDPAGTAAAAVSAHEGAANPHPVYLTQAEGDALYEPIGAPAAAAYAATITVPWSAGGGSMTHSEVVSAAAAGPSSVIAVSLAAAPDVAENDAEELDAAVFSASYAAAGQVRISAAFRAPVSGAINLAIMVI